MASWEKIEAKLRVLTIRDFGMLSSAFGKWASASEIREDQRMELIGLLETECLNDHARRNELSLRVGLPTDDEELAGRADSAARTSMLSAGTAIVATCIALLSLCLNYCQYRTNHPAGPAGTPQNETSGSSGLPG